MSFPLGGTVTAGPGSAPGTEAGTGPGTGTGTERGRLCGEAGPHCCLRPDGHVALAHLSTEPLPGTGWLHSASRRLHSETVGGSSERESPT